jgi:hypothetical protein
VRQGLNQGVRVLGRHGPHAAQSWPLTGAFPGAPPKMLGEYPAVSGLSGNWSRPVQEYVQVTAEGSGPPPPHTHVRARVPGGWPALTRVPRRGPGSRRSPGKRPPGVSVHTGQPLAP